MPNITLEPDMCACNIDFEVGEYARMVVTELPDYTGATTVTPSKQTQTLETANTAVHSDITVEAIPYDEVEAATPVISVNGSGKVTATTTQAGGIVESSTKTAEYQQPIVARAKPTVSVNNAGKITASTSQAGGFVQSGTETTELQQETVTQATPTISVASDGVITATATQTAGFVSAGTKSATLQQTTVEQATPSISVAANGTVTASATQTGGFVLAGTKSATYSLPTQAAATITPTESAQTAVPAGKFTTGAVQVGAIPSDYIKPSGTLPITSNGTYDVKSYANANVSVLEIETESLTVTENGVYTASSGHAYTPITVNVEGGGKEYPAHNDDLTYFYIDIPNNALLNVPLTLERQSGTVTVYWGDGSQSNVTGSGVNTLHHEYQEPGEYTIVVDATAGTVIYGGGTNTTSVFGTGSVNSNPTNTSLLVKAVEIGRGGYVSSSISQHAFAYCANLESVVIKHGITDLTQRSFINCAALKKLSLPNTLTTVGAYVFNGANNLSELILPDSITSINAPCLNLYNVINIHLPSNAVFTGSIATTCLFLEELTVPASVTSIPAYGFSNNTSMRAYHFLATTPPALADVNAFYNMPSDCVFYVPAESLEAYKTASNWSTYASRMVGE